MSIRTPVKCDKAETFFFVRNLEIWRENSIRTPVKCDNAETFLFSSEIWKSDGKIRVGRP